MKIDKRNSFSNDVIFIDGLWGTGKSLLGPIVSGMAGVERVKIESLYEYVSWLFRLGRIEEDAAIWLLRTYADCTQYHNVIGREINLRWGDDTGLRHAPDKLRLIRRLFGAEGDGKVEEINRQNLGFCAMSHMLMLAPELLVPAYEKRVKVIEMVRHPLYMVGHFSAYLARFESPREFTISFYHDGKKIPWFVDGWEDEYVHANPTERAVLSITRLFPWLAEKIKTARAGGLEVLDVSFEEIVFETDVTMCKLQEFMGRVHHSRLPSILKRQMLPRETIAKGRGHPSYGWSQSNKTDSELHIDLWACVRENCSTQLQADLQRTIDWYNLAYPSRLGEFG